MKKVIRKLRDRDGKVIGEMKVNARNPSARTETRGGYTVLFAEVGINAAHNKPRKKKSKS